MSRLDEQLERDFTVIADRVSAPPSPDAWAAIQRRIADREPNRDTEIIMLTENTLTRRRWPIVAAAAAVVALAIAGVALVNSGGDDEVPANPPPPTDAPSPEPDTNASYSQLPPQGEPIAPGRYAVNNLGVPIQLVVPDDATDWTVQVNDRIAVTLGDGTGFVNLSRLGSFYGADQSQDPETTGLGSIAPNDIDTWIEANDIVVEDSREVTVGGRRATYRQVRVPDEARPGVCPVSLEPCVGMATASADLQDVWDTASVVAYGQFSHTFWIVELDDFEPLGIWAHTESPDTDAWLAEIAPLIDGITFGEPGPAASGGTARLSAFVSGVDGSGDEASPLPSTGATMEAGTYTTSSLGLPITFDIVDDASWRVSLRNALAFAIETDRGFVAMQRMGSFYDAEQAQSPSVTGLGSIPPDDFDGWIEANGVTVDRSEQVTVDGRPADLRVVRAPDGSGADLCPAEAQPCIRLNSVSADAIEANPNDGSRIDGPNPNAYWMIELDDFEPLGIWAYAVDGDIDAWLDEIAPIIASIALGDPGPAVEGGTARVPLRVTVSAPFSGVRTNGEQLDDGSTAIGYEATSEGPAAGEITGTGWAIPGAPTVGHDENVFTGSIGGVGTGTLSWTVDWTGTNPTDPVSRGIVTGGTGDFAGVTGVVTPDLDSSDQSGGVDAVTGTNTFELVIPRSG